MPDMTCECHSAEHRGETYPELPHWPGEGHLARLAVRNFIGQNDCAPTRPELMCGLTALVGHRDIAVTILDNAVWLGAINEGRDGSYSLGDNIPLAALRRHEGR